MTHRERDAHFENEETPILNRWKITAIFSFISIKSSLFWHLLVLMISCARPDFLLLLGFSIRYILYWTCVIKEVDWSYFDQFQYRRTIDIALLFMKELMYENLPARREIVTINKVYNQTFYKLIDFRYEM